MNDNPYSSPNQESTDAPNPATTPISPTAFREGYLMVVRTQGNQFGPICVGSGREADDWHTVITKHLSLPAWVFFSVITGGLGALFATWMFGSPITVTLPVNRAWLDRALREAKICRIVVGVGAACALGGILLIFVNEVFLLVGLALCVISLGYAFVKQRSSYQLKACRMSGTWIWVSGVAPVVLKALPPFEEVVS